MENSFLNGSQFLTSRSLVFIYFGYADGYSSAVPGYCLLLVFMSWMAENVFLSNTCLLSHTVPFTPLHLDPIHFLSGMGGFDRMGAVKGGAVWHVTTFFLLQGCLSVGQAGQKSADLDVLSPLAVCLGQRSRMAPSWWGRIHVEPLLPVALYLT